MRINLCARVFIFVFACCIAGVTSLSGQTFKRIVKFHGTNGKEPTYGSLLQGLDGSLYGTTSFGGLNNGGEVFKISPTGEFAIIYSFCPGLGCPDGSVPDDGVLQGFDSNFYGTTSEGGTRDYGTIFKLTPEGALTTLHDFCPETDCTDGAIPIAGLIQGTNENFYGTTTMEVAGIYGPFFEVTPAGQFTTLHTFCALPNCIDGAGPAGALTLGTDGKFYGVTGAGGRESAGTIFQITAGGKLTTLHSFDKTDGEFPNTLLQASDGNLYGTTEYGGLYNKGVVFTLTKSGQFSVLHNFCSVADCADGATSNAPLIEGTDGNFYGVTTFGGVAVVNGQIFEGFGTIFQITPAGQFTTLYTFCSLGGKCADGAYPLDGLIQATDGNFYGTTYGFEASGGSVFQLSMGLASFVAASPEFGQVGHPVHILGNNLTRATSVSFNGIPAKFKVSAKTFITAEIPSGATTGKIEVTTSGETLSSNAVFTVIP